MDEASEEVGDSEMAGILYHLNVNTADFSGLFFHVSVTVF